MEIALNDQNFDEEIQKAEKPVLIDFWTVWCEPCNVLSPILDNIADEYQDKIILAKVNLDAAPLVSQKLKIERIPTVILFINNKPVSGFVGVRAKETIKEWLDKTLEESGEQESKEGAEQKPVEQKPVEQKPVDEKEEAKNEEVKQSINQQEIEETIEWYKDYAERNGFQLNPDKRAVDALIKGLLANEKKYGARYCPCRKIIGKFQEDRDKICPCRWCKEEIEKDGHCYCNLFYKK
ncbi:MAG: thioredoxin [Patescibacteria group bacterium]|nr:thioredoxin [Patescibacteria group bacterium]